MQGEKTIPTNKRPRRKRAETLLIFDPRRRCPVQCWMQSWKTGLCLVLSSNSFASAGSPNVAFRSRQRTFSTLFFSAPLVALGSTSELPFLTGQCL
jgi:hypothetical protein